MATLAAASLFCGISSAQSFPARPVKLIVPFAAGGSVDAIGRALAAELAPLLGQPVVVENKAGAGSVIGTEFVARAPADGYTLLITSPAIAVNVSLRKKMPYDARKDLAAVAMLCVAGIANRWIKLSLHMACLVFAGVVLLGVFWYWQSVNRAEPLMSLELFRDRNFTLSNIAILAMGFAVTGMAIPLMLYAQKSMGLSVMRSASSL